MKHHKTAQGDSWTSFRVAGGATLQQHFLDSLTDNSMCCKRKALCLQPTSVCVRLSSIVGLCITKTSTLNRVVIKTIWTQQQKLPVQDVLILSAQLKPHYLTNNCYFLKPLQNATQLNWKTQIFSLTLFLEDLCYKEVFCSSFRKATESNHNM